MAEPDRPQPDSGSDGGVGGDGHRPGRTPRRGARTPAAGLTAAIARARRLRGPFVLVAVVIYAALLAAHHLGPARQTPWATDPLEAPRAEADWFGLLELPTFGRDGQPGRGTAGMYIHSPIVDRLRSPLNPARADPAELWAAGPGGGLDTIRGELTGAARGVVVALHGSPGGGANFSEMALDLEQRGYAVLAPDLPGFSRSDERVPDYSTRAHAGYVLAMLDTLGIDRFHAVGWSMGGGVALHLADLAPGRVLSCTLMGSVGGRFTESSGSAAFEWLKYQAGTLALGWLPELVPHFGRLGDPGKANWIRNFDDTDFASHGRIMRDPAFHARTPVLILHGRQDFLTPLWTAREHRRQMPNSRLVVLDGVNHFIPWEATETASRTLAEFFAIHDGRPRPAEWAGGALAGSATALPSGASANGASAGSAAVLPNDASANEALAEASAGGSAASPNGVPAGGAAEPSAGPPGHTPGPSPAAGAGVIDPGVADTPLSAEDVRSPFGEAVMRVLHGVRTLPFWLTILGIAYLAWSRPETTTTLCGLAVGALWMDFALAFVGLSIGRLVRRRGWLLEHGVRSAAWRWVPTLAWQLAALIAAFVVGYQFEVNGLTYQPAPLAFAIIAVTLVLNFVKLAPTWRGRRRVLASLTRVFAYEYWPRWAIYGPLLPFFLWQAVRRRGVFVWTCCNPGVAGHGGIAQERKSDILESMQRGLDRADAAGGAHDDDPTLLAWRRVSGPDPLRTERAIEAVEHEADLGGYPIMVKPEWGYRGVAVRLANNADELARAVGAIAGDVQLQRYHPGPHEAGLLWIRSSTGLGAAGGSAVGGDRDHGHGHGPAGRAVSPAGYVYSVTRKVFPEVVGDGRRTLERLILDHPRHRCLAETFCRRHADRLGTVLPDGLRFVLSRTGNHSQGCIFADGSDLLTPELTRAVDRLLAGFVGAPDSPAAGEPGSFDLGRLDIRYEHDAQLRAGRGFAVVELNGVTSEPTHMYDPGGNPFWAWAVLAGQWHEAFRLGALRRDRGVRPMGPNDLVSMLWRNAAAQRGSSAG